MTVKFDEALNPRKFQVIKFNLKLRRMQYLEFFGVIEKEYIKSDIIYIYVPSKLEFKSYERLVSYLYSNLIIYDEVEVDEFTNKKKSGAYYIDTSRIFSNIKNKDFYTDPEQRFHSVQDIARLLKCSRQTIYNYIKEGRIEAINIDNKVRISQKAYIQFLEAEEALKKNDSD